MFVIVMLVKQSFCWLKKLKILQNRTNVDFDDPGITKTAFFI